MASIARRQPVLVALILASFGLSSRAQEPPTEFVPPPPAGPAEQPEGDVGPDGIRSPRRIGEAMTLELLQQTAIQNNPTLAQAQANLRGASGRRYQAGRMPNPTIGYMGSEIGNEKEAGQEGGFVEQEFVRGCKLQLSQAIVDREMQQAEQVYAIQELRVRNAVRREFFAVLVAERRRELAGELVRIANEARDSTDARLQREEGTQIELSQAIVEFESAALLRFNADKQLEAAWRRLRAVVNAPSMATTVLAGKLEQNIPELTWESSRDWLVQASPEMAEARLAIARAQAKVARARVEPTPNVIVQASTQYDAATRYTIAGLQIGLPIPFHNDNRGNIIDAEADIIRTLREVERLQLSLESRLADVFRDYQFAKQSVERYRDAILPASNESLELSRTAYEKGELSYLQLLTAQRLFTDRNREYVDSLANIWDSVIEIEGMLLTGGLEAPRTIGTP